MNLLKCLEKISSRQGAVAANYKYLDLDALLSRHTIAIEIKACVVPREITFFSQIQHGNTLLIEKNELNIIGLEIGNQKLKVRNV